MLPTRPRRPAKKPKNRNTPEADLQQECIRWFRKTHPEMIVAAVPNEACARGIEKWVSMGLQIGIPDVYIVGANRVVWVEFKSAIGRKSPQQKEVHEKLAGLGHEVHTCRTLAHFKVIVEGAGRE